MSTELLIVAAVVTALVLTAFTGGRFAGWLGSFVKRNAR